MAVTPRVWNKNLCVPWIIVILIMYFIPSFFDFYPDRDSYLGGIGFLGIWGTLILTTLAIMLSVAYGFTCVHEKTVYRCAGWGCANDDPPLVFPDGMSDDLKNLYKNELSNIDKGILSHHPWSAYNKKLAELNAEHLYSGNSSPLAAQ